MNPHSQLDNIAIRAALEAGKDIMAIYDAPAADFGIERKADNSPLTRADKAAHARIMSFLEPTGIPVLSEEGAHLPYEERRHWRRLWIVDPLDGTKEFIKRNGEFTVNIALVENGMPVMGVIYRPTPLPLPSGRGAAGALYFGFSSGEEQGAWRVEDESLLNNPSITVEAILKSHSAQLLPSSGEGLWVGSPSLTGRGRGWVCVASRSHLSPETEAFIENLRRDHPDLELVSSGSSLKICLVAEGRADIYPRHAPTMEWDTAAGHAIALAAGCEMIDANTGEPLTYNKPDLHNPWFIVRRSRV